MGELFHHTGLEGKVRDDRRHTHKKNIPNFDICIWYERLWREHGVIIPFQDVPFFPLLEPSVFAEL